MLAKVKYHANDILDFIHGNLCSAIMLVTPCHYMLDDANQFMWIAHLTTMSDVVAVIKNLQAAIGWERPPSSSHDIVRSIA